MIVIQLQENFVLHGVRIIKCASYKANHWLCHLPIQWHKYTRYTSNIIGREAIRFFLGDSLGKILKSHKTTKNLPTTSSRFEMMIHNDILMYQVRQSKKGL